MKRTNPVPPEGSTVRRATREDATTLAKLRFELFVELGKATTDREPEFVEACRATYAKLFDGKRVLAWIAEDRRGGAVAALTLLLFPRLPTPAHPGAEEGYVVGVFTRPRWRGRGIALALTSAAIDEARRRGLARIRLHATEQGRRVYESRGFRLRGDEMELAL